MSPHGVYDDTTVTINPGAVATKVTDSTFQSAGGIVVVGGPTGSAYVATSGAVRQVNLTSFAVSTFAGSTSTIGCAANNDPLQARFQTPSGIDSDGTNLFVTDPGCRTVWKIVISTGVTTALTTFTGGEIPPRRSLVFQADSSVPGGGYLYLGGSYQILRVNSVTGATTTFANYSSYAIAADASYLWVAETATCLNPCTTDIKQLDRSTGALVNTFQATDRSSMTGDQQIVSAGSYLYAETYGDTALERITKSDGTVVNIAGTGESGSSDGTGTDAWFSSVSGLASDGTNLWAADSPNSRLVKVTAGTSLAQSQAPSAAISKDFFPGRITTQLNDGSIATAGGMIVIPGSPSYVYIAVRGAIQRVNLSTFAISTYAGSTTVSGCQANANGLQAQFADLTGIDTDGHYLYVADTGCHRIWRVSLAAGAASSTVTAFTGDIPKRNSLTFAPDVNSPYYGYLYLAGDASILRIDPINGTTSTYLGISAYAVTSDSRYLWAEDAFECRAPCYTRIDQIDRSTGAVTYWQVPNDGSMTGDAQLVSAGSYLYATSYGDTGVERITKSSGSVSVLAGGSAGQSDGEWSSAKFSKVAGLAFDGTNLWIADSGNQALSKADFVPLLDQEMGATSSSDSSTPHVAAGDPVDTNPSSGAFTWSSTDLTLPTPGLVPFSFTRYYNSKNAGNGIPGRFGPGWSDSFSASVSLDSSGNAEVSMPNGQVLPFTGPGPYTPSPGIYDTLVSSGGNFSLTQPDGTKLLFTPSPTLANYFILASITDRDGNAQTLNYGANGILNSVTASFAGTTFTRTMTFTYVSTPTPGMTITFNDAGTPSDDRSVFYATSPSTSLTAFTDLNGNTWTYGYSGPLLTQINDPSNEPVVTNAYLNGQISSQQDGDFPASHYDYTSACSPSSGTTRCTHVTDGRGNVWEYDYSSTGSGILTQTIDADGNTVAYGNPDVFLNPQTITDARHYIWNYTYCIAVTSGCPAATGAVHTVTSPLSSGNGTVAYVYDPFNEVHTVSDARGKVTTYFHNAAGDLTCQVLPTASSSTSCTSDAAHTVGYTEYADGQVHTVTAAANNTGGTQRGTTTYTYFGDGMVQSVTAPAPAGTGTSVTTYTDVAYGTGTQTVMVVTPRGNANGCGSSCSAYTWTYTHDNAGNLTGVTDPLGHTTSYGYDNAGRLHTVTNARLKPTTYNYRPGSTRPSQVRAPFGTGQTATTTYLYDGTGNLACEVLPTTGLTNPQACNADPTHTVSYGYTADGRTASVTDPEGHTRSYDYSSWVALGKVTETLPGGGSITRTYDDENRPTGVDYSDTTPDVSWDYGSWTSAGKVTMTDQMPGGSVVSTYDALGHLTSAKRGSASAFTSTYMPDGSLASETYPDGASPVSSYFPDGSLSGVVEGGKTTSFAYDVAGGTATKTLPNGILAKSTFDNADRLTNLTNCVGTCTSATTISKFNPTLDADGNPTQVVVTIRDASTNTVIPAETDSYTYDDGDRLTQACYGSSTCSSTGQNAGYAYTYDAAGNRLTKQVYGSNASTTNYLYDGGNQLCWSGTASTSGYTCPSHPGGGTTYSYNSRGDLTNNGGTTLSYDLADRPTQVVGGSTTDTYTYDGAGNRLTDVRAGVTTNFTWDVHGSLPLLATDSDGSASSPRDYVYGDGLMYERAGSPVKRYYYTRDAFGSVSDVTDPTAVPMEVHTYDPFGAKRTDTVAPSPPASYANLMEFDGEYHDPTGYYNLRAREYLPGQGRFARSDPVDPASYAFVGDHPTVMSDPSGMFSWGKIFKWVGIGLAAALVVIGVAACVLATEGICAGVGIAEAGSAAGAGTVACEEGGCSEGEALRAGEEAAETAAPRFIANSSGEILDTRSVIIPESKLGYLLENPSKAGVFDDSMGFSKESLDSALRAHLFENFSRATESVPMINGEGVQIGTRFSVTGQLAGPSGVAWSITSAWGIDWDGTIRLITATP